MQVTFCVTPKQKAFLDAGAQEVLFGGAAGGGKSYAQLIDAFLYAMRYKKSRQIMFRRTFSELEKSLVRKAMEIYPKELYSYHATRHVMEFVNGSVIDFGYCDGLKDAYNYQSLEFDVLRFDELTHFTEDMYLYLISRLRGANDYPKQVKSSTNPGGVGHAWVKRRFLEGAEPGVEQRTPLGSRIFLPSLVTDNPFLMEKDPGYIKRLQNLPQKDQQALLYGNWDIFEGQFFSEWDERVHICEPFEIPRHWQRFRAIDYGLDMFCWLFLARSPGGQVFVYREVYEKDLVVSQAARRLLQASFGEPIVMTLAPPDLWGRRNDTGKSAAQIFAQEGVLLVKSQNDRAFGNLCVKDFLRVFTNEFGQKDARLKIFRNCANLIRTLPAICYDAQNPADAARSPHELTHAPDALRYFCSFDTGFLGESFTGDDAESGGGGLESFLAFGKR